MIEPGNNPLGEAFGANSLTFEGDHIALAPRDGHVFQIRLDVLIGFAEEAFFVGGVL